MESYDCTFEMHFLKEKKDLISITPPIPLCVLASLRQKPPERLVQSFLPDMCLYHRRIWLVFYCRLLCGIVTAKAANCDSVEQIAITLRMFHQENIHCRSHGLRLVVRQPTCLRFVTLQSVGLPASFITSARKPFLRNCDFSGYYHCSLNYLTLVFVLSCIITKWMSSTTLASDEGEKENSLDKTATTGLKG